MTLLKLFNPKAFLLLGALTTPLAGCEIAGGVVAGVAAREAAEAAGADKGTANALGAAAALATIDALQQRSDAAGQCNTQSRTQTFERVPNGTRVIVQQGQRQTPGFC